MSRLEVAAPRAIREATAAPRPASVAEAAGVFGGTGALADALGVTQRTIQRYIKGERGGGGETRKPSAALRERIAELTQAKEKADALGQMRENGATATFEGEVRVSDDVRTRDIEVHIPGELLSAALDAFERGDTQETAYAFEEAFGDAYGVPGMELADVDVLTLTY